MPSVEARTTIGSRESLNSRPKWLKTKQRGKQQRKLALSSKRKEKGKLLSREKLTSFLPSY
jgi:hypothetical protein